MSLNYPGGRISNRVVLSGLTSGNFRVAGSMSKTSIIVIGAYNFVRSTGGRTVRGVLSVIRLGGRNMVHGVIIANYLTRECESRMLSRVPRISTIINVNSGSSVYRMYRGIYYNRRSVGAFNRGAYLPLSNGHVLAAPSCCTCVGVNRKYSGGYACYTVPSVHKGCEDHAPRDVLRRTGTLMSNKMGRLVIITRSAAHCKRSLFNGYTLPTLLASLSGVRNVR